MLQALLSDSEKNCEFYRFRGYIVQPTMCAVCALAKESVFPPQL